MIVRLSSRSRPRGWAAWLCGVAIVGLAWSGGSAGAAGATVPGAPKITLVTSAGSRAVTVSFTKPGSDGGARIVIYRAVCTSANGGVAGAHNASRSPIPVPSLSASKNYTCTVAARNRVGIGPASKPSSPIIVRPRPPAAPTITSVRAAGLRTVTVAFTRPADDGGAPISHYRVVCTSRNGGVTRAHQASTSPISVAGMSAAVTYTCTVAATNSIGLGRPSAPSRPVIPHPTAPGAPTITAVKAGLRSVTVAFTKPTSDGGAPITNYLVRCISHNGGDTGSRDESRSPIRVASLTATKTYTCTVSADNKARRGPNSRPSKPVIPLSH